jgi:uncharacterized protein with PIN domain
MAYAYCPKCNIAYEWFAGKGFRLEFLRCPRCGGKLKSCSYEEAKKCLKINHSLYDDFGWRSGNWEI